MMKMFLFRIWTHIMKWRTYTFRIARGQYQACPQHLLNLCYCRVLCVKLVKSTWSDVFYLKLTLQLNTDQPQPGHFPCLPDRQMMPAVLQGKIAVFSHLQIGLNISFDKWQSEIFNQYAFTLAHLRRCDTPVNKHRNVSQQRRRVKLFINWN